MVQNSINYGIDTGDIVIFRNTENGSVDIIHVTEENMNDDVSKAIDHVKTLPNVVYTIVKQPFQKQDINNNNPTINMNIKSQPSPKSQTQACHDVKLQLKVVYKYNNEWLLLQSEFVLLDDQQEHNTNYFVYVDLKKNPRTLKLYYINTHIDDYEYYQNQNTNNDANPSNFPILEENMMIQVAFGTTCRSQNITNNDQKNNEAVAEGGAHKTTVMIGNRKFKMYVKQGGAFVTVEKALKSDKKPLTKKR